MPLDARVPSHAPTSLPTAAPLPDGDAEQVPLADLGLPEPLRRAVRELGWSEPTPIQLATVPALLAGRDLVGVAQTGTGKTGAFGLPLLAAIDPSDSRLQALVLAPTRELARQVADALTDLARHLPGVHVVAVHGGAPYGPQQRALSGGAQVVVGTPGRLIDHLDRGSLALDAVRTVVLDEADEMLRMGFAEDVERLLSQVGRPRQVALFSATMPTAIERVAATHLQDPVRVAVSRESSTAIGVRQTYAVVPFRQKTDALVRVLAMTEADAAIVFTRTRARAEEVGAALVARGVQAAMISGDVAQPERERVVARLRDGSIAVVVATDVAARGLDVERVGLVVNLDVPGEPESYVHRVGRTGRAGRTGEALTFVTPAERSRLRGIERTTGVRLEQVTLPTPGDVAAHLAGQLLVRVQERLGAGRLERLREKVAEHLAATGTDPVDLATALVALGSGDDGRPPVAAATGFTDDHLDARDVHRAAQRERRRPPSSGTRYRLAVGHTHGAGPDAIVGALTGEGGLSGKDVGKIDVFSRFSLVEIATDLRPDTLRRVSAARVAGRPLRIAVDSGPPTRGGFRRPEADPRGPRASRAAG